jgi:hypothetical protein
MPFFVANAMNVEDVQIEERKVCDGSELNDEASVFSVN